MNPVQIVEDNILIHYRGIARHLGGRFIETEQVAWFTTGRRSLLRFNAVLRTADGSPEALHRVTDPIGRVSVPEPILLLGSLVPDAEMVVFGKGSHMAHLAEPEHYVQVVRHFPHRVENRSDSIGCSC